MLLFIFWGCSVNTVFPDIANYGGELITERDYELDGGGCDVREQEPNDGEVDYDYSTIGALLLGDEVEVCGSLSHSSLSGTAYTGDYDYFLFHTLNDAWVEVLLTWTSGNADFHLSGENEEYIFGNGYADPERSSGYLSAGYHYILVVGQEGSPDYTLTISVD